MADQLGGRPPLREDAKVEPHSVGFWPDLWRAVCVIAEERGVSVSELVRAVLLDDPEVARRVDQDED